MTRLLERYKLAGPYEQGNNGRGFIATDLGHNRLVVLKAISCLDNAAANRAFEEWPHLCKLRHPKLVTALDAFVEGSNLYLVYEYVDGNSLSRLLKADSQERQPITPKLLSSEMVEELAGEILSGLVYLHANQINHGALRSENIWLGETVKLTDSGLASLLAISQGQPALPFDPQADLWKLGQLLYRCLSGVQTGTLAIFDHHQTLPNVSTALHRLLLGLCATDPADQFISADVALASLTPSIPQHTTTAKPPATTQFDLQELLRQREMKLAQARVQLGLAIDLRQKAMLRWEIAGILLDKSEFAEALQQCQSGLEELDAEDLIGQLRLLSKRLEILNWQGDNEKALQLIDLDNLSVPESKADPAIMLAQAHYKVVRAKVYQALGKHDLVRKLAGECLATYETFADKLGQADVLLVQAFATNWVDSKFNEAILLLEKAKVLCEESGYLDGYLRYLNQTGGCYWNLNDFAQVRYYFDRVITEASVVEARHHLARALLNKAILESNQQNLDNSLEFTRQTLNIATRIGLHSIISHAYAVTTEILVVLGRISEAVDYGRKAMRYNLEYPNSKHYLDILSSYTLALIYSGNLIEAERLTLQQLEDFTIPTVNYLSVKLMLAKIRLWQNRPQEAFDITTEELEKLSNQIYFPQLVEAKLLQIEALFALPNEFDLKLLLDQLPALFEQAQVEAQAFITILWTMQGRLLAKQRDWEGSQTAFKQAIEVAERRKEALNLATAYFYFGESLLERIKQGDTKTGLRSRAVGMIAHAADLFQEAGENLYLPRAISLLNTLGVARK